jgi:hypothetical protein
MNSGREGSAGPVTRFLVEDHQRLDNLLRLAVAADGSVDSRLYDRFRAGLLRHIGMEEKILLPTAQRLHDGGPLPIAAKLRLDHGALASLLMPTPTTAILGMIRGILKSHNILEEGPGGLYETCETLARSEIDPLLAQLRAAPEVIVMPHADGPIVMNAVQRAVERAGYTFREGVRGDPVGPQQ